jgi:hypothetical protein
MPGLSDAERARFVAWAERWGLTPAGTLGAGADGDGLPGELPSPSTGLSERDGSALLGGLLTALLALALLFGPVARSEQRHGYGVADLDQQRPYVRDELRQRQPVDP